MSGIDSVVAHRSHLIVNGEGAWGIHSERLPKGHSTTENLLGATSYKGIRKQNDGFDGRPVSYIENPEHVSGAVPAGILLGGMVGTVAGAGLAVARSKSALSLLQKLPAATPFAMAGIGAALGAVYVLNEQKEINDRNRPPRGEFTIKYTPEDADRLANQPKLEQMLDAVTGVTAQRTPDAVAATFIADADTNGNGAIEYGHRSSEAIVGNHDLTPLLRQADAGERNGSASKAEIAAVVNSYAKRSLETTVPVAINDTQIVRPLMNGFLNDVEARQLRNDLIDVA